METDLMAAFADPEKIKTLTAMQLLWGSLFTTLLGMGITFVSLYLLQILIGLFEKIGGAEEAQPGLAKKKLTPSASANATIRETDVQPVLRMDDGLVPAITAVLAVMLEVPAGSIVIRGIRKIEDTPTAWSLAGIADQIQNRAYISWGIHR